MKISAARMQAGSAALAFFSVTLALFATLPLSSAQLFQESETLSETDIVQDADSLQFRNDTFTESSKSSSLGSGREQLETGTTPETILQESLRELPTTVTATVRGRIDQTLFADAAGFQVDLNGEPTLFYVFQDDASAQAEADRVVANERQTGGSPASTDIASRFYHDDDQVLVQYIGRTEIVQSGLRDAYGPSIAEFAVREDPSKVTQPPVFVPSDVPDTGGGFKARNRL